MNATFQRVAQTAFHNLLSWKCKSEFWIVRTLAATQAVHVITGLFTLASIGKWKSYAIRVRICSIWSIWLLVNTVEKRLKIFLNLFKNFWLYLEFIFIVIIIFLKCAIHVYLLNFHNFSSLQKFPLCLYFDSYFVISVFFIVYIHHQFR